MIIFQTAQTQTGSTLLVNMLYGFMLPTLPIAYYGGRNCSVREEVDTPKMINILKTHVDIGKLMNKHGGKHTVFFVCCEREDRVLPCRPRACCNPIEKEYRDWDNVLIFDYSELLETETNSLENIIDGAYDKISNFLPEHITLSKESCLNRINAMNARYEEIKDEPFTYIDRFYELHGSHRGRKWPM